jgi:glycosyltransferase involved in cell wall biosynthesis
MKNPDTADVGLFLEGTYPYVLGGVSAWVDQIVRGLPEVRFALFFIGAQKEANQKPVYQLAPNVVSLAEVYLQDRLADSELTPAKTPAGMRSRLYEALAGFYLAPSMAEKARLFWGALDCLDEADGQFTFGNLCHDRQSWEIVQQAYEMCAPDESFIDFFWTARFLHLPLWILWRARRRIPPARLYHSISAGYAGFLGAVAARQNKVRYLVTEHGIYTKERIAEISQADWIYEPESLYINLTEGLGKLKQLWIDLFVLLGQVAYQTADNIVTLYEGNALTQIEFGADARKILIIPNGIEPAKFNGVRDQHAARWQTPPALKYIGFVGRVVPIKDVKTLIRAARLVCEKRPEARFLIAGPYSEDPNYFDECQKIAKLLKVEDKIEFLGQQKLMDVLPKMDVLVLTSISEGLPLVILEAMAGGIPVVATDVGACRELIFGRTPPDKELGLAGRLTKILSPTETANALVTLLEHPEFIQGLGRAGRKRVENHYSMSDMLQSYRDLYQRWIQAGEKKAPAETIAVAADATR